MDFSKNFFENAYDFVCKVPKGKVVTYGEIARAIGNKRMSRQVGWALHKNPQAYIIPCHRVVFADGRLSPAFAFGGENEQRRLLEEEGVIFNDEKVDKSCFYKLI